MISKCMEFLREDMIIRHGQIVTEHGRAHEESQTPCSGRIRSDCHVGSIEMTMLAIISPEAAPARNTLDAHSERGELDRKWNTSSSTEKKRPMLMPMDNLNNSTIPVLCVQYKE